MRQRWESELEARKGHQRNEYKNWIIAQVGETLCSSLTTASAVGNRSSMFVSMQTPSMEESFTIHLGSQLKHMHNIRILSADINDLCSPLHSDDERSVHFATNEINLNVKFDVGFFFFQYYRIEHGSGSLFLIAVWNRCAYAVWECTGKFENHQKFPNVHRISFR